MLNDKKIYKNTRALMDATKFWLTMVDSIGEQCVTTDRIIENVIRIGDEIKKLYNEGI